MSGQIETEVAYPASWWASQSAEQLQEFVRAGFMSGQLFDGAQRELERRARESTRKRDEAANEELVHRMERGYRAAVIAAVSFLVAICALIWMLTVR